jgi:hypothetical protein
MSGRRSRDWTSSGARCYPTGSGTIQRITRLIPEIRRYLNCFHETLKQTCSVCLWEKRPEFRIPRRISETSRCLWCYEYVQWVASGFDGHGPARGVRGDCASEALLYVYGASVEWWMAEKPKCSEETSAQCQLYQRDRGQTSAHGHASQHRLERHFMQIFLAFVLRLWSLKIDNKIHFYSFCSYLHIRSILKFIDVVNLLVVFVFPKSHSYSRAGHPLEGSGADFRDIDRSNYTEACRWVQKITPFFPLKKSSTRVKIRQKNDGWAA